MQRKLRNGSTGAVQSRRLPNFKTAPTPFGQKIPFLTFWRKFKMATKPSHGGSRPGAGRPKKPATLAVIQTDLTPMAFMLSIMQNPAQSTARRMRAAALLLPYMHTKPGGAGVKDAQQAAGAAASGKFAVPSAPRLAVVTTLHDKEN